MDTIAPLLRQDPGEIVVMLMTEHVRRFITDRRQCVRSTFDETFGISDVHQWIEEIPSKDRDAAILNRYMHQLQKTGGFKFASAVQVLHGLKARTHFHLIYLTRHHRGIEKFKDAERKAMDVMESARAEAEKRSGKSEATPLFDDQPMPPSRHYDKLRKDALEKMQQAVDSALLADSVTYDDLWALCMRIPLVWYQDVSAYVIDGKSRGNLEIVGMKPRQRVLKPDQGLTVMRR